MDSFIKKFVVAMVAFGLIAGAILSDRIFSFGLGVYILYSLVPLVLGVLFFAALAEKKAGMLAFCVVAMALFAFLLLIDKSGVSKNHYILSAVGVGLGALIYFFQIRD